MARERGLYYFAGMGDARGRGALRRRARSGRRGSAGTRVMRVLAFLAFVERKRIHTRLRENTAHCCKNKVE